jgi:predicted hotdog family 3-hydroxylacyl-ACP dehydratase
MIRLPLSKPELFAYTPHQGDMLLLDRLEEYSLENASLRAAVEVKETSALFDPETGRVPVWAAFEYMAQCVGLLAGLLSVERGGKPNIGFIMGIRNFIAHADGFTPGQRVEISVKQVFRDGDVAVFEGRADVGGKLAASGIVNTISGGEDLLAKMKEDTKLTKKEKSTKGKRRIGEG